MCVHVPDRVCDCAHTHICGAVWQYTCSLISVYEYYVFGCVCGGLSIQRVSVTMTVRNASQE